jgi:hypothetical protein
MISVQYKLSLFLVFTAISFILGGCSGKSNQGVNDQQSTEKGSASFIVSGATKADKKGGATVVPGSEYNFKILISDNHTTYNLNFAMYSYGSGPVERPGAGEYAIKGSGSKTTFTANYQLINQNTEKVVKEFNSVINEEDTGGTLTVDSVNNSIMKGHFKFTVMDKAGEKITVDGSFEAIL